MNKTAHYNIRFPTCNVMVHPKKYFNVDTGKYNRDKLEKITSYTLGDIIDDSVHNHMVYGYTPGYYRYYPKEEQEEESCSNVYNFPKFEPKDNDFDIEERKEQEEKKRIAAEQKELAEIEKRKEFIKNAEIEHGKYLRQQAIEQEAQNRRMAETAYQEYVRSVERRLALEKRMEYCKNNPHGQRIITSKWGR